MFSQIGDAFDSLDFHVSVQVQIFLAYDDTRFDTSNGSRVKIYLVLLDEKTGLEIFIPIQLNNLL